jgi:hypothetical protein
MALSNIEQVRMGIGDITTPYILSDVQIQHYLDTNSDDVVVTIEELQPIILSALASRGALNRAEDLWEDTTSQTKNYRIAMEEAARVKAATATPIIGGAVTGSSLSVDMFDPPYDEVI